MNTLNSQFRVNATKQAKMEPTNEYAYAYIAQSETTPQHTVLEQNVKFLAEAAIQGDDNIYTLARILDRLKGTGESKAEPMGTPSPGGTLNELRGTIDRVQTQHNTLFSLLKELETLV